MSFNNCCLVSTSLFLYGGAEVIFDDWRLTRLLTALTRKRLFSPLAGTHVLVHLTVPHHMSSISTVVASDNIN